MNTASYVIALLALSALPVGHAAETITNGWITAAPEEVGLDSAPLVEMLDVARHREISVHSIQIVRHGQLALDAYFYPYSGQTRHDVASVTKSVTSTLVGLAIERGHLRNVREPVLPRFAPRVIGNPDARKQALTIEHLLTMQAGWDCGFEPNEARLFEMRSSSEWSQFMLDLPMVSDPGARWAYCSGNCHLLSVLVSQVAGTNALAFARRELFAPLGIHDIVWPTDGRGNPHGWGDLQMFPRDMAKLGQLFLQRGSWRDTRIISEAWIREATRAQVARTSNADRYGYFWWVKGDAFPGMYEAVGRGGQRIIVWPAKDLVLVFTGGGFEPGDLAPFILKAIRSDSPLARNPEVVARLRERLASIRRPPAARPVSRPPALASQLAGKTFRFAANSLKLSSLSLKFDDSPALEAQGRLAWDGHDVRFPIGLDAVERFSPNPLVDLPQAVKGQWINDTTFQLQLNLVGGINQYQFDLAFADGGRKVNVELSERTGLNKEQFEGHTN